MALDLLVIRKKIYREKFVPLLPSFFVFVKVPFLVEGSSFQLSVNIREVHVSTNLFISFTLNLFLLIHENIKQQKKVIMFTSKQLKCSIPLFMGYLLLSGEAIQVSNTIELHTAFLTPSIHSSAHNTKTKSKQSVKMVLQNGNDQKPGARGDFFNRLVGGGLLGFGLMNGGIQTPDVANAADVVPAAETRTMAPRTQPGVPEPIRYSDFLDLIQNDRIEKVTFSSDGQRLVATDTDGARYRLDALPNDPELLATLTQKMVDVTVLPEQPKNEGGFNFVSSILFPGLLFLGLFFLARRGSGAGGGM